jgi:tetratricopeptide (TPR) repeat protein
MQRLGFLAGPLASYSAAGRRKGYLAALQEASISYEAGWMSNCQPSVEGGYEATHGMLAKYPQLTALFCFNDLVAVGALQACDELKRRVPQDLAIVGHDDIPLAALVSPARTLRSLGRVEEALSKQLILKEEFESAGESDGYVFEEIGECLLSLGSAEEARPYFSQAYTILSGDLWLAEQEPERMARLKELGGAPS